MIEDPRIEKIREIDTALAEKGWPRISPWWWNVIETFYESGVLGCVIQGGRRGGKSATIAAKVAVAELLTTVGEGEEKRPLHDVPPGDIGYFGMVSAEKGQAKARLSTAKKALRALGYNFDVANTEELILQDTRLGIKAVTASKEGVVSFTCIGFLADEMALWSDDRGDNPASEVVESLKPTMATMPNARGWYVSAPWAELGLHYEMMEEGDNESQLTFQGATWEMNPTLTEEATHKLERDFISWQRAYAAIPLKSDESKFFASEFIDFAAGLLDMMETVSLAISPLPTFQYVDRIAAGGDFAFRRNSSAMVALAQSDERLRIEAAEERVPGVRALKPSKTIKELSDIAIKRGADSIACDLHYIETVRETTEDMEIELLEYPSNENAKWFVRLRVLLSEGLLDLRGAPPKLISQLKGVTGKPLDGGGMRIQLKEVEGAHGDMVSALVCAVWAMEQPKPEKRPWAGERRFSRGGDDDRKTLRDYPPED